MDLDRSVHVFPKVESKVGLRKLIEIPCSAIGQTQYNCLHFKCEAPKSGILEVYYRTRSEVWTEGARLLRKPKIPSRSRVILPKKRPGGSRKQDNTALLLPGR